MTVIVPTKDAPAQLARCLGSIFARSTYPSFDVLLVDNGTTDPDARRLFEQYPVDVLPFDEPFNFSRANNLGVARASAELVVFLNNDTEVQTPDWLEGWSTSPSAGRRGGRAAPPLSRTAPSSTRVVLGLRGTADHIMRGFPGTVDGYAGSLSCTREVSAVTGACMAIRRDVFLELGGFDEHFATHYQDVDLCLRLGAPAAESSSRPASCSATTRARPAATTTTTSTARSSSTRGARRSPAAIRTTTRCSRSQAPTTDPAPRRERRLRQLPRLHEQQRGPHLQPRERARRPRGRLRGRRARRPGHDRPHRRPAFQALDFADARNGGLRFPDGGPPTLVHAWTPREVVRELTEELARATAARTSSISRTTRTCSPPSASADARRAAAARRATSTCRSRRRSRTHGGCGGSSPAPRA